MADHEKPEMVSENPTPLIMTARDIQNTEKQRFENDIGEKQKKLNEQMATAMAEARAKSDAEIAREEKARERAEFQRAQFAVRQHKAQQQVARYQQDYARLKKKNFNRTVKRCAVAGIAAAGVWFLFLRERTNGMD